MYKFINSHFLTQKHIFKSDTSNDLNDKNLGLIQSYLYLYSFGILLVLFAILFVTSLGFFIGLPITKYHYLTSIFLSLPIFYIYTNFVAKPKNLYYYILICVFVAITFLISSKISGSFYDVTYDGQGYHQDTIIALSNGWNPFYKKLTPEDTPNLPRWKWINSYAKASEIIETVIYKGVGRIEIAKSLNILMLFMAFGFVFSLLLRFKKIDIFTSFFISLLFIFNPINITQLFSFYLDGQLYLVLLSLISLLVSIYITHKNYFFISVIGLITLAWDLKLTGVVYSTVILISFMVLCWYTEKILLFFKCAQATILSVCLALLIVGYNPFITNLFEFHNPLYFSQSTDELLKNNLPENLIDKNSTERLVLSIFSRSDNVKGDGSTSIIKNPFTYSSEELATFINPDNNESGFGPLFGASIVISIFGVISIILIKSKKSTNNTFYYLLVTILICSIVNPASSYARYIPLFWTFPVVICFYLLIRHSFLTKFFGILLFAFLSANIYLIANTYYIYSSNVSATLRSELVQIKNYNRSVDINFGVFRSNRVRFSESNIKYTEYSDLPCDLLEQKRILIDEIPESKIIICNLQ